MDPDEIACYELSLLKLHSLQRYLYWVCRDEMVELVLPAGNLTFMSDAVPHYKYSRIRMEEM